MNKKLLIFDLDETLIYATTQPLEHACDFTVGPYSVYKRPHVDKLIDFCAEHFHLAVWTSSTESYAAGVTGHLFGGDRKLEFTFARRKCVQRFDPEIQDYFYIKDLRKAKARGFALSDILILDDTPRKLMRNYGNLIRMGEWTGDSRDLELLHIRPFLLELKEVPNVRKVEKRSWQRNFLGAPGPDMA